MSTRPIRFRVESNKSKSSFWYTLVAGNGDTVMTSKATYSEKAGAKRAAKRMIEALLGAHLVLEFEDSDGVWIQVEQVAAVSSGPLPDATAQGGRMTPMHTHKLSYEPSPVVSTRVADERLNPNN